MKFRLKRALTVIRNLFGEILTFHFFVLIFNQSFDEKVGKSFIENFVWKIGFWSTDFHLFSIVRLGFHTILYWVSFSGYHLISLDHSFWQKKFFFLRNGRGASPQRFRSAFVGAESPCFQYTEKKTDKPKTEAPPPPMSHAIPLTLAWKRMPCR